jgi:uncharacterized protein YcbK (DUF882 family)
MGDLSPNFSAREFRCKDGSEHRIACGLLCILEAVRAQFGPVAVCSGYRSASWNKKVGGAKDSYHVRGMAADIQVPGHAPRAVYDWVDAHFPVCGLGLYASWVHVDCRPVRARWGA